MILYHFSTSPYARRVRLALALKGQSADLRDARANPEHMAEVHRLNPMRTVPVLVDGDRTLVDSAAILQYIDRKFPAPPLWPDGVEAADAYEIVALCDGVIGTFSNLGMRYAALHTHPDFPRVREEAVGRAQRALDVLSSRASARAPGEPLVGARWSAADIALFALVDWLEALPARAETYAPVRNVIALGWTLPPSLVEWARAHRGRSDVKTLAP